MESSNIEITVTINNVRRTLSVGREESLLGALRGASYFSVKVGCDDGTCGVCTVLLNGKPVHSCRMKAVDVDDQIQKKNIRVDLKLAKEPAMVSADYPQMVRLLETFIKNAVHQMEQGSVLAISTSVSNDIFFLFLQYPVRHMAPDDVEHFFYPFAASQVSYDTVDLPMTKIIVHKHGGTVDVFLDKSGELVIRVSLPLIEESKYLLSK